MFGQDPQLPVDFLLGRVQEPAAGHPHVWTVEHQTRLNHAFESATKHLAVAAAQRKENYDKHVRDIPFQEGQLVLLRDTGVRGRHKIQDIWGSTVYKVLKAPGVGGSVYTSASAVPIPMGSSDGDWAVLISKPMAAPEEPMLPQPVPVTSPPSQMDAAATLQPGTGPEILTSTVPIQGTSEAPWRTARSNAGQHSNIYHLPQAAGSSAIGAAASLRPVLSGSAVFRPWQ